MRQITAKTAEVFLQNDETTISMSNTNVTYCASANEKAMFLHGNLIAIHNLTTGKVQISNAGWESNTTKERLNGILSKIYTCVAIERIYQQKGTWYYDTPRTLKIEFPFGEMITAREAK